MIEAQGTKKMWDVFRSLTTSKKDDPARVISDGERQYASQRQKANVFVKQYKNVSSLKLVQGKKNLKNDRLD